MLPHTLLLTLPPDLGLLQLTPLPVWLHLLSCMVNPGRPREVQGDLCDDFTTCSRCSVLCSRGGWKPTQTLLIRGTHCSHAPHPGCPCSPRQSQPLLQALSKSKLLCEITSHHVPPHSQQCCQEQGHWYFRDRDTLTVRAIKFNDLDREKHPFWRSL